MNRLHVINSRTAAECILTLSSLRDIMKIDRSCLLIIDSASSLFGYIPIKEMTITRSVFLDYLKHIVETFSIQCLCFRMLTANQVRLYRHINATSFRKQNRPLFPSITIQPCEFSSILKTFKTEQSSPILTTVRDLHSLPTLGSFLDPNNVHIAAKYIHLIYRSIIYI